MTLTKLLDHLPRGDRLDDATFRHRHRGIASFVVTAGLTYTAAAFTVLSGGSIETHVHFFVIIGLIALYQDWVPFMWNIACTVLSHGLASAWDAGLILNHLAAIENPWLWSLLHGSAVLAACIGVVVFWRETENAQQEALSLTKQLAATEITQRKFTSDLLVNLARRNQSMLYRQLDILSQLEEKERDPGALSELFRLDHLATRIRRNAESLLVLSDEEPTRVWSEPVRLIDVMRAAIEETEDLDRSAFAVDERLEVLGHTVSDLTPVLAERTENAQRLGLQVVARLADAGSRKHTSLRSCVAPRHDRLRSRPITSRRYPAVRGGAVPLPGQQASSPATDGRYPPGTLNRTERN